MRSWNGMHFEEAAASAGVPLAVAMAARDGNTIYANSYGPGALDSIFAVASMTKAITSAVALQLVEEGSVPLHKPLEKYLPALGGLPIIEGFSGDGEPVFGSSRFDVTLYQLLTHTAGFAYPWNHPLAYRLGSSAPPFLVHPPGTRWHYGVNVDWIGRLIEAVTGEDLETCFQRRILGPLGMTDTSFLLPPHKFPRLVLNWQRDAQGQLQPLPHVLPAPPAAFNGGGGLYSTAPDYLRFLDMILRRGLAPSGQRILSESSIVLMTENQTGTLPAGRIRTTMPERSRDVDFHPGHDGQFTLGFLRNPVPYARGRSAGSLAWGGIRNTFFWVDPPRGVAAVLLMQFQPFCDPAAMELLTYFEHTLYKTL